MIDNWEQFFCAVATMREHQKVWSKTRDPIALKNAIDIEKIVDDCITARQARQKTSKGALA